MSFSFAWNAIPFDELALQTWRKELEKLEEVLIYNNESWILN
jgi:hypothetical protein